MPGQKQFEFLGVLMDTATNYPITGATVQMQICIPEQLLMLVGYETKEIIMTVPGNDFTVSNEIIKLNQISILLGEVVVASNAGQMIRGRAGLVSVITNINSVSLLSSRVMTAINDSIKFRVTIHVPSAFIF
jgi:hypothetical protein